MARSLAFLHTVTDLVPVFEELAARYLPDWTPFNIVDESLLRNTIKQGELTKGTMQRVANYIRSAVDGGAEAILVTCSSIGPAVDAARPFCPVPLVRVDEGMVDLALTTGKRIGVLATLASTLRPTEDLIRTRATQQGYQPTIIARLCDRAFERLSAGDRAGHDTAIVEGIAALEQEVDVIVLAQASMARAAADPRFEETGIPILSSPELGILHFRSLLPGTGTKTELV
ncbi:aspartate/glutamate racemase family protein [Phyllobacterium sp. SB3]|uniref:aspartate/glutamate racemase family protein n=1 Tax=Phyllobacterium sp. SB3 TaxID=3156073 RepID=UPI0032AFAA9C